MLEPHLDEEIEIIEVRRVKFDRIVEVDFIVSEYTLCEECPRIISVSLIIQKDFCIVIDCCLIQSCNTQRCGSVLRLDDCGVCGQVRGASLVIIHPYLQ